MNCNTVLNDNYGLWQHVSNKYKKVYSFILCLKCYFNKPYTAKQGELSINITKSKLYHSDKFNNFKEHMKWFYYKKNCNCMFSSIFFYFCIFCF